MSNSEKNESGLNEILETMLSKKNGKSKERQTFNEDKNVYEKKDHFHSKNELTKQMKKDWFGHIEKLLINIYYIF